MYIKKMIIKKKTIKISSITVERELNQDKNIITTNIIYDYEILTNDYEYSPVPSNNYEKCYRLINYNINEIDLNRQGEELDSFPYNGLNLKISRKYDIGDTLISNISLQTHKLTVGTTIFGDIFKVTKWKYTYYIDHYMEPSEISSNIQYGFYDVKNKLFNGFTGKQPDYNFFKNCELNYKLIREYNYYYSSYDVMKLDEVDFTEYINEQLKYVRRFGFKTNSYMDDASFKGLVFLGYKKQIENIVEKLNKRHVNLLITKIKNIINKGINVDKDKIYSKCNNKEKFMLDDKLKELNIEI